jgi:hypothetical protein
VFKKDLAERLHRIFGIPKVTFENSDDKEQNLMFVDVTKTSHHVAKKTEIGCIVDGLITVFAPNDKLTFGFFQKRLHTCDPEDGRLFFFYNLDQSNEYFGNLIAIKCNFSFFFKAPYDPEAGVIDEVNFVFAD